MDYKFFVLFGVVMVAAVQVYAEDDIQYFTEDYESLSENELKDKIDDLLTILKRVVDQAQGYAQKGIDSAKNKLKDLTIKVEPAARKDLEDLERYFRAELDKLKEQAKHGGANIDGCLEGNEDTLVNLPDQLADDMDECLFDKLDNAKFYAQHGLDQIKKIVGDIENPKQEYENCGTGLSSVVCLAKLAVEIGVDISTLPVKIAADSSATVAQITLLYGDVKHCAVDKVDQCKKDGYKVLEAISVCVSKRIVKN